MLSWKEFAQRYAAARQMPESKLLFDHKGVLYPSCLCSKQTFKVMDSFEARKDDVLMASYPKCVVWGSYFDHAVAWNKYIDDEDICVVTFEEMKQDLQAAVKKISDFFGLSLTQEQVQHIAEKGTFKSMKEKSKETHGDFGQFLFRKGDIGDWKNHFSEAQNQEFDTKFEKCLAGTKLGEMLKYNVYCK